MLSLCGKSKRTLLEDPVRRFCLRQCLVGTPENQGFGLVQAVRPRFQDWEGFCRDTAGLEDWDNDCLQFNSCILGCDVLGGSRTPLLEATGQARFDLMDETYNEISSSGMSVERRCEVEKCRSYCAREVFDTCREQQYAEQCLSTNPRLYNCDVNCSNALRRWGDASPLVIAALMALQLFVVFPAPGQL